MDYNAPFGSADPNAGYADRNTPGAVSGSRVPGLAIEMPQREIVTVIKNAGLTPDKTDPTQLDQAIDKKIEAVTGGGGDDNYVLMTQARVRLPIFPEILTADGKLPVVSPSAGVVRVPAGYEFLHRGIFLVTTVQVDLPTLPNKTYHLRWTPSDGFALKDLADVGYNSAALAEVDAGFDSAYDSMLSCRIQTNASNIAAITNLVNRSRLRADGNVQINQGDTVWQPVGALADITSYKAANLDWARTPRAWMSGGLNLTMESGAASGEVNMGVKTLSRYQLGVFWQRNVTPGASYILWMAEA